MVNRNIVVQEGGVLVLESIITLEVDCFTLEGELQIISNTTIDSLTLVRSTCQTISPAPKITVSSPYCEPKIFHVAGELRGSIVCTTPEDNSQRDTIIIVVSVIIGSAFISGAIVVIILTRRRRQRINQLKSRVELLTLSTTNTNKGSSPPEGFTFKLLEDLPIKLSTTDFKFGFKGNLFVVDKEATDSLTVEIKNSKHIAMSNKGSLRDSLIGKRTLVQFRPIKSPKHRLIIEPQGFDLPHGSSVEVTLRLTLTMTTKTKVSFWIELPEEQVYSLIEFDAASEPSSWIDVDDVEIEGDAIGEGGFGAVYKAHYRGQQVAYKTMKMQELGASFDKEFEQEVRMMMNLHHKNILQFIGASRVRGKLAILTEYISQGNLAQLLLSKPLDIQLKKKIILDIAEALHFLHSNNILHRDIKAENILVVSTLKDAIINVKLADFGTARSTTEQVTSKFTKGVGTPLYMAVEVLKNETYERSADVFSFGVLMWAIMSQEEPYKDFTHSWDIAEFVLQGKRLPIRDEWLALYKKLITRAWAQNPRDRLTMTEIVTLLSNYEEESHVKLEY
jgi:predicted Ser/Thr protein kinase